MDKKFIKSIVTGALFLIISFSLLFLWHPNTPTPQDGEQAQRFLSDTEKRMEGGGFSLYSNDFRATFVDPLVRFSSYAGGIFQEPESSKDPVLEKEGKKKNLRPLTDEEVFSFVWPTEYKEYLATLQDILIREGFLSESERSNFSTDQEIFSLLLHMVDYMESKQHISLFQAEQFRSTLQGELPLLIGQERSILERAFLEYEALENGSALFEKKETYASLMRFIEYLRFMSSAQEAHAQTPGGDIFQGCGLIFDLTGGAATVAGIAGGLGVGEITGGCYKDFAPFNLVCGFNTFAPCCNCSAGGVPIGCLNGVCAAWPNAIWDEDTGICGCG
ncbi:MAG: hypothetical protein COU47_02380 [Candidatus Niyogibacteria bacterium CG10_big_fil_rev_8_21_14_0_10_46_36]|uniref:Uncharacterized protein n=1 Tax=Candidatus Niyogibacteria bacterium CG10_big_fil_rev_8_21_14_0_10_46_36 TaxID=1974726 RepID=A0A2H0TDD7_9BACT|nr:MAG: hypothetical protein COU47_02380 [Candidatus Niyogibacteria bacterium CG10_big_fil_rev_8_21_14_0_10_46_36]